MSLVVAACTASHTSTPTRAVPGEAESVESVAPAAAAPPAPAAPPPGAGIVALAAGTNHTCALRDGQVWCWGLNRGGILGVGGPGREDILKPHRVVGLERVVQIVADYDFTCAVDEARAVYCWGDNDRGQLGSGDVDRRATPTRIADLAGDRLIAGFERACARDGARFRCWGTGELGDGVAHHQQKVPLEIAALARVDELVLGDGHACTLTGGVVRCWGQNDNGQLGNGEGGCRYEREPCPGGACLPPRECKHAVWPVGVVGVPAIVEVGAGGSQTYLRAVDGAIWGTGQQGVTMDFGADNPAYRPRPIEGLPVMVELDAGNSHACARTAGGEVWCWGNNSFGQLGHPPGIGGGAEGPARVASLPPASALALGFYFTCALTGTGAETQAWCWGDNGRGQLGDGTTERRDTPVPVRWD